MLNYNVPHLRSLSVICTEIIVQVKILLNSDLSSIKQAQDGSVVSVVRKDRLQTRSFELLQIQRWDRTLQSTLNDDYNNFSGKIKHVPHFKANNWKIFPKPWACTFTSEQFHWFIQLCKETLQHFARSWRLFLSVMWSRTTLVPFYLGVSLSLFFSFLILWQLVIAFLIMKTIILLGIAGHQIIVTISAPRASLVMVICLTQRALVVRKFASTHARLWRWGWRDFL